MSPATGSTVSSPFTPTDSVNSASFASIFSVMTANFESTDGAPSRPTSPADFSSAIASISASISRSAASQAGSQSTTFSTSSTQPTSAVASQSQSSDIGGQSSSPQASSGSESAASVTAGSSSTAIPNNSSVSQESGGMSSAGKSAAIAVPVVVVALAALAIFFLCMRRRRKQPKEESLEKAPVHKTKKKWTRHLRVFSFDTELLMGGRFSSTNSIRSRQTGSLRSQGSRQEAHTPSLHSIDEVAPPYRDAIHAPRPASGTSQVIGAGAMSSLGAGTTGLNRNASNATAPPPYPPASPPRAATGQQNPFADSPPVSPIEDSPFNDPPNVTPGISRNSSLYHAADNNSIAGVSDAGSIREAQVGRNASVLSRGRVIQNVSRSSQ